MVELKLGDYGIGRLRWRARSSFDQLRVNGCERATVDIDTVEAMCNYTTLVPGDYMTDRTVDDAGLPTIRV